MLRRITIAALLLLACATSGARADTYVIDGHISDWGVNLQTYSWKSRGQSRVSFVQSSFKPNPQGSIEYKVEDYSPSDSQPRGGEYYDYEAAYFDDSTAMLYVGVISSHPWNASLDVFRVIANGITINAKQFDQFAWANLGIDEVIGHKHYPNYFYEGAISASRFGQLPNGSLVTIYANCNVYNPPPDSITLSADRDHAVPEPTSIALVGLALTALVGRQWRRRNA